MRWFYLLAGALALLTGSVHALMGGIDTLNPAMAADLPLEVRATLMTVWHAITLLLGLTVLACLWAFAHAERARPLGVLLGLFHLLFGVLFLVMSLRWFEQPMVLPQWTLLVPLGVFTLLAAH